MSMYVKDYIAVTSFFLLKEKGVIQDVLRLRKIGVKAILLSFPFSSLCREVLLIFHFVFDIR